MTPTPAPFKPGDVVWVVDTEMSPEVWEGVVTTLFAHPYIEVKATDGTNYYCHVHPDSIFRTPKEAWNHVVEELREQLTLLESRIQAAINQVSSL